MKNAYLIILLLIFGCFTACEKVVELDVPREDSKLVVNSFFSPDSTFGISLYESAYVLDESDFETVSGASATIRNAKGDVLDELTEQEPGIYTSNIKPQPGKTYRLKVSKPGNETVTAENQVPVDTARISNIELTYFNNSSGSAVFSIWIDDLSGEDYYELYGISKTVFYSNSDTLRSRNIMFLRTKDPIFDDLDIENETTSRRYLFFDDALFNGQEREIILTSNVRSIYCPPSSDECETETKVTFYLRKTSEAYFKYKKTLLLQGRRGENPFAEPVPVYDNIENGIGIFAGFRENAYSVEVTEPD